MIIGFIATAPVSPPHQPCVCDWIRFKGHQSGCSSVLPMSRPCSSIMPIKRWRVFSFSGSSIGPLSRSSNAFGCIQEYCRQLPSPLRTCIEPMSLWYSHGSQCVTQRDGISNLVGMSPILVPLVRWNVSGHGEYDRKARNDADVKCVRLRIRF